LATVVLGALSVPVNAQKTLLGAEGDGVNVPQPAKMKTLAAMARNKRCSE
jgi:hypothetical protein